MQGTMNTNPPPSWANPSMDAPGGVGGPTTIEQHEQELFSAYSTLDEPIMETIMRDVNAVVAKLKVVMKPLDRSNVLLASASYAIISQYDTTMNSSQQQQQQQPAPPPEEPTELSDNDRMVLKELKDWDLWGPLVLCLCLAVLLSLKAPTNQSSLVFAAVFCSVWAGGTIVTINSQLLGSTISFFQSLCVLGYSLFPLTLSALIIGILSMLYIPWLWLHFIIVAIGFVWSIRASSVFISLYIKPERRFLALYPVLFFYIFMSWMILLF